MGMTTLLTLASMFGSLTNVTPPISYTTRLDVWMVACIVFVFGTMAEFTVVIFLKYYLPHLPLDWFHKLCLKTRVTPPTSAEVARKPTSDVLNSSKLAWVISKDNIRHRAVTPGHDNFNRGQNGHKRNPDTNGLVTEDINDDEIESLTEEELLDERKQMAEKVIKQIDKYSVIVFLIGFSIFMAIYWYQLLHFFNNRIT